MRIFFFSDNKEQLESIKDHYSKTKAILPFSSHNELFVMRRLIKLSNQSIQAYPRTLEGDRAQLQRDDLTQNQRNALQMTISEKEILFSVI